MKINEEDVKHSCIGLDAYKAEIRIKKIYPDLNTSDLDYVFIESKGKKFIVLDCAFNLYGKKIIFYISSSNPISYLPSNYQDNEFLRNFLMIFQHVNNEISMKLDNMHNNFRPMECNQLFLPLLADWFGVDISVLGNEEEVRKYLQFAVPLYRLRGTVLGIKALLFILTGIVPQIIEGELPYTAMEITESTDTKTDIFEIGNGPGIFTVYFPIYADEMNGELKKRLLKILKSEKPAHTKCCLSFMKREETKCSKTKISEKDNSWMDGGTIL